MIVIKKYGRCTISNRRAIDYTDGGNRLSDFKLPITVYGSRASGGCDE